LADWVKVTAKRGGESYRVNLDMVTHIMPEGGGSRICWGYPGTEEDRGYLDVLDTPPNSRAGQASEVIRGLRGLVTLGPVFLFARRGGSYASPPCPPHRPASGLHAKLRDQLDRGLIAHAPVARCDKNSLPAEPPKTLDRLKN
jgi:hypothetical protein